MLNILDSGFGIQNSMMTTVHAYTADQPLADDTKFRTRRSRSMISSNHFLKTICWYDNGWGFSKRILEIISAYNNLGGKF